MYLSLYRLRVAGLLEAVCPSRSTAGVDVVAVSSNNFATAEAVLQLRRNPSPKVD